MKNIEDSRSGPYDARTGIARGTRGVLRIIRPNHKYADVSSRMGPAVAVAVYVAVYEFFWKFGE